MVRADSDDTIPWDAVCEECGAVHIIRTPADMDHEEGDTIESYTHAFGREACGHMAEHTLRSRLDGLL